MGETSCNSETVSDPAVVGSGAAEPTRRIVLSGVGMAIGSSKNLLADIAEVCGPDDFAVSRTVGEDWRGNQKRHERMWRRKVTSASQRFQRRC